MYGVFKPEVTLPLVAMAEMERAVTEVTITDIRIMSQVNTEMRQMTAFTITMILYNHETCMHLLKEWDEG